MADAPPDADVVERKRLQGHPWHRTWWRPCGQTLQTERNTVIHAAPCMNRAAASLLQQPKHLAKHGHGAQAFPTTCCRLRIVETSAWASAAKSHHNTFHLQWPATSATGIDAACKDSHRRAAEMADAPPDTDVRFRALIDWQNIHWVTCAPSKCNLANGNSPWTLHVWIIRNGPAKA